MSWFGRAERGPCSSTLLAELAANRWDSRLQSTAIRSWPVDRTSLEISTSHMSTSIRSRFPITFPRNARLVLFCPNRWYPVETHGIFWRGTYYFGNKPLVNYLPRPWRDRLAPHVRTYTRKDLNALFEDLPVKFVTRKVIFGGYDNIINRFPRLGRILRAILYWLEDTPLQILGLSHYWVVEKQEGVGYDR